MSFLLVFPLCFPKISSGTASINERYSIWQRLLSNFTELIQKKQKQHECEQWFEAKEYEEENATIKDLFRQWYQNKKKKITQSKKRNELRTPFWIPAPDREKLDNEWNKKEHIQTIKLIYETW